ncbi:MAG TPA: oligosaccharide flippase family protein [Actinomycetota bacterium]|nr:oligosaccharide flippase family protein [Actinomycetota bacterium]
MSDATAIEHGSASRRIDDVAARAARGAPWVAASALVSRGLLAGVVLVLAAVLSPYEFGVLSIALLLSTVFIVLVDVGFATALVFEQDEVEEAAASAMGVSIVVGVSVGIGLLVTADAVSEIFRVPDAAPLIRAYAGIIALSGVVAIPLMRLNREFAFRRRFAVETLPLIAGSILTIVLAIEGVGVWSLVIGDATRCLLTLMLVLGDRALRIRPRWHPSTVARLWPYARGATVASILDIVLLNVDYALVARLLGATALGFYSLGFRIAIIPFYVVTMVVVGAGWPAMTRLRADDAHLTSAFRISVRVASGGVMLFVGGTIVLAPWLVLLSPDWESAVSVTRLLAVFVVFRSACYLLQAYFQSVGRTGLNAVLRAIWLVLLVCLIATVGRLGVDAVAGIQVVVAAMLLAAHVIVSRTIGGAPAGPFLADVFRPVSASVVAASLVLLVQAALPDDWSAATSWAALLGAGTLFVVLYVASLRVVAPAVLDDLGRLRRRLASRNGDRMREPTRA